MASSSTWAQDLITCDLCDNLTQQFCNNCQVSLCGHCINKHVESLKSHTHDIVPFTDREERLVFPSCASHPKQRCEGHCQQCNVPVCFNCLTGTHRGHIVEVLTDIVKKIKEEIKEEMEETESYISRFTLGEAKIDQKISKLRQYFENLEREGEKLRKTWHEEVDNIFNTLQSTIRTMKDTRLGILKSHKTLLQNVGPKLVLIMKENMGIMKSNKVIDVTCYKSKLKEFREIPTDVDVPIPALNSDTVKGSELSVELAEYKAKLRQTSISNLTDEVSVLSVRKLLDKAKVITSISSGVNPLYSVVCVGADEAWVHGKDKALRRIGILGWVRDMVTTTCEPRPANISLTRNGELLYSDYIRGTVTVVKQGRKETLITLPQGWHSWGLCCTRSGDILLSMCTSDQSHYKIVRFQGQTAIQEINKDEYGQRIFSGGKGGFYVAENNNEDICASDINARTVLVVNKTGKFRFRYDGTPAKRIYPFEPVYIVTDSISQIIISDIKNNCLHILDEDGQFLKCVDTCCLNRPRGLSLDSEGRLWVGSINTGVVKVIQYIE